jgi:hypothetical protein
MFVRFSEQAELRGKGSWKQGYAWPRSIGPLEPVSGPSPQGHRHGLSVCHGSSRSPKRCSPGITAEAFNLSQSFESSGPIENFLSVP